MTIAYCPIDLPPFGLHLEDTLNENGLVIYLLTFNAYETVSDKMTNEISKFFIISGKFTELYNL